mgnify:CR=1 FL=1
MNIVDKVKKFVSKNDEVRYWKERAERYERLYKQEMLRNQATSHAILQVALLGEISCEAQRLIYEFEQSETTIIYNTLY